ncbi:50S ribosomal protein P1 [Candidatus Pacearchaeota archaeon]|nr:50S ribosomal protein P1 [Candidatus Pacearchaeota archaeon]
MENIYAALLLHKAGKEVTEDNLKSVVAAAGVNVDSDKETQIKSLIASLKDVDIDKELESASLASISTGAGASSSSGAGASEEKKEEAKPKEEKKEAAAEGLSALFG